MERIDIEEVHSRVLAIAKEFDRICTLYGIPYYMIGGTMLGAIRHKGFIPWDDDMDFGVPIEHYQELINILEKELPYPFRCCTYKNHPAVLFNFLKIEDQSTCIDDVAIDLPLNQKLGLNIDIFPLNVCNLGGKAEKKVRKKEALLGKVYLHSTTCPDSKIRGLLKTMLRIMTGGTPKKLQKDIEDRLLAINKGNYVGNILGRWGEKEVIPQEWYGFDQRYPFEDTSFVGIEEYDKYLTRLYGDYMLLPPKEEQVAHVENVFLR